MLYSYKQAMNCHLKYLHYYNGNFQKAHSYTVPIGENISMEHSSTNALPYGIRMNMNTKQMYTVIIVNNY